MKIQVLRELKISPYVVFDFKRDLDLLCDLKAVSRQNFSSVTYVNGTMYNNALQTQHPIMMLPQVIPTFDPGTKFQQGSSSYDEKLTCKV